MTEYPRRGEIWLIRFDPTLGSEIKKTRPAFIISNNIANQYSPLITVLPISDVGTKIYPHEVDIHGMEMGLSKPSKIKCQQIRTVDKERLVKKLGSVGRELIPKIEDALKLHLGMI